MKMFANLSLKTRAMLVTAIILLFVFVFNTVVNISVVRSRFQEALIARTAALAEGLRKEINKAIGFGLPLNALDGMGDKLRGLMDEDKNLSGAMIMDAEGRVLYAGDQSLENTVPGNEPDKEALAASEPTVQFYKNKAGGHYEQVIPLLGPDGRKIGVFRIALREAAVTRQVRGLLLSSIGVGLISFLIAMVLVHLFMDRRIARPISDLSKAAKRMASGDLTQEAAVRGEAEIADLCAAINTMASNIRSMLQKIRATGEGLSEAMQLMASAVLKMSQGAKVQQEATEQTAMVVTEMAASNKGVAENAEQTSQAATQASSAVTQMASSIEEVARNASALSAAVEETTASVEEMIASIKQVSENTDALSVSAEQTSSSIAEMSISVKEVERRAIESARLAEKASNDAVEHGTASAAEAIKGMQNIKTAVEATAEVLNRLGNRSQEIGQILKVIDEVTDQTGLLALNAAILAAQAGEHGKGFAVVAEEIRDLAERTAASTQEISGLVAAVREESAQSLQAMARGLKAVETGVDLVSVTNDMLEQLAGSSRQSVEMARSIEKATAEQTKGVAQITETSVSIAEQIDQIAGALKEQRKGSERIVQAAERMRDITRKVKTATQEQSTGGKQIAGSVESVTRQAAEVARSTAEQNIAASQIGDAIGKIQKITEDTVDVSVEMDMAVHVLRDRAGALQAELDAFKV